MPLEQKPNNYLGFKLKEGNEQYCLKQNYF